MLDIPMLQTTPKPERVEHSPSPKEMKAKTSEETEEADFGAAYADEGEETDRVTGDDAVETDEIDLRRAAPSDEAKIEGEEKPPVSPRGEVPEDSKDVGDILGSPDEESQDTEVTSKIATPNSVTNASEFAFNQRLVDSKPVDSPTIVQLASQLSAPVDGEPKQMNDKSADVPRATTTEMADIPKVQGKVDAASGPLLETKESVSIPQASLSTETAKLAVLTPIERELSLQSKTQLPMAPQLISPVVEKEISTTKEEGIKSLKPDREKGLRDPIPELRVETKKAAFPVASSQQSIVPNSTAQPLTQLNSLVETSGLEVLSPLSGDLDAATPWDSRGSIPTALMQAIARPETPSMVGRQMAEAIQRLPDKPVEVALNPEELGKVRMSISATDGGITVNVLAERPETLELMRRHIDQLAREFQALGYQNINFAFGEGQTGQNSDPGGEGGNDSLPSSNTAEQATENAANPIQLATTSGLDLRL